MTPAASQKRMASMRAEGARSRPRASGLGPQAGEEKRSQRGNGFSHKLVPAALGLALLAFAARADPGWLQRHLYQPGQLIPSGHSSGWQVRAALILAGLVFLGLAFAVRTWGAVLRSALAIALAVAV